MAPADLERKGCPAEKVGEIAAEHIGRHLSYGASVDTHLADQLVTYVGLAGNGAFTTYEVSKHTLTNIHITELFLGVEFDIRKKEKLIDISVK